MCRWTEIRMDLHAQGVLGEKEEEEVEEEEEVIL